VDFRQETAEPVGLVGESGAGKSMLGRSLMGLIPYPGQVPRGQVFGRTPKAHAPPALNRSKSGPAGYVLDHFSQLPMNDDHLYPAKRGTTPGRYTFSRRQRWRIGGGRNRGARRSRKTA
jgi:ABC-type dipeptide/oligopeptide/nickel transport system ATPase component